MRPKKWGTKSLEELYSSIGLWEPSEKYHASAPLSSIRKSRKMKTIDSLQVSPAESLFIIIFENPNNGASAIARKYYRPAFRTKLMTLTFFDLLLRKVLKVDFRIESFGFIFKRTSKRTYIVRGEYFSNTNLKPHELPFKNCIERTNAGLELRDLAERLKGLFFEL